MSKTPHKRLSNLQALQRRNLPHVHTAAEVETLDRDLPVMLEMVNWVKQYCARPHPDLGRSGSVCPFVPPALRLDTLWFTVERTADAADVRAEIEQIALKYRDAFLELEPKDNADAIYKSILIILPDVTLDMVHDVIDETQKKLKPDFVRNGTMLGEFHMLTEGRGLRNPDFRPLRSPIPMLVIRSLVETDFFFLLRESDPPESRVASLEAYLRLMGHQFSEQKRESILQAIEGIRQELATKGQDSACQPA